MNLCSEKESITALHIAVKTYTESSLFREVIELLMLGNCHLDTAMETVWTSTRSSYFLETALYRAIDLGKIDIAIVLLQHGSDVNAECPHDLTVLQKACTRRMPRLVDVLLHCGIDWHREEWLDLDIQQCGINTDTFMVNQPTKGLPFILMDDLHLYLAISTARYGVPRLVERCRLVIRSAMQDKLYMKVKGLGLPRKLEDFIMLRDL